MAAIEEKAELIARTADSIWGFAELSLPEERSAALYCKTLEDEGFTVETERAASSAELLPPEEEPVDINAAGVEELATLPGIGEKLARRIVDYRAEHGPFSTVDELVNVSGIGEGKLEALRGHVRAG